MIISWPKGHKLEILKGEQEDIKLLLEACIFLNQSPIEIGPIFLPLIIYVSLLMGSSIN